VFCLDDEIRLAVVSMSLICYALFAKDYFSDDKIKPALETVQIGRDLA